MEKRENGRLLNEGWRFFFKSENSSDNARHVTLPHTWDTDTGGTGYFLETTANYQNDMYIPAEWATKRLFVKFYGVQSVADVFVNGYYVGGDKVYLDRHLHLIAFLSLPKKRRLPKKRKSCRRKHRKRNGSRQRVRRLI